MNKKKIDKSACVRRQTPAVALTLGVALAATSAWALEFKVEKNIPYFTEAELQAKGAYAANRCKLDVKYPVDVSNFATVVNFHGGGLVHGNKHFAPWPKERHDLDPVCFVGANYRLITNATPGECISDAAGAVAWTLRNIARFGGDPKKVFVTGISGGGYLTAMVGLDPKWLAAYGLKPTDLAGIAPLTGQMTKHFNVRKVGFKDADPQFLPKIDEWTPLNYAAKDGVPPAAFLAGSRDVEWKVRVEENEMLAASMRALGNRQVEFHETEGDHGAGVTPSAYFLRDFVMKTVEAGGVARFAPGERIAFFGDSITHGGRYVGYLQLFAALRHPGWDVRCYNTGVSGDTAAGGVRRWDWDVLGAYRPTRAFVMFGMNDVGRDNSRTATPTEGQAKARAASLVRYEESQRKLAEMIPASGVKAVFVTPSPFDQYSDVNTNNLVACNDPGLAACARIVREIADERKAGLVEFHSKMTEILKAHPELHLCGGDRVHPGPAGHLLMAALVLEAMGERPLVAQVAIDAKKGVVEKLADGKTRNAAVTAVAATPNEVRFTYAPKALPLPALPEYVADDKIYPLTEKFNQETIRISGLAEGRYDLAFDGAKVGSFTAAEFAKGVNVALLDTPNQKRAQETASLVAALVASESNRRMIALQNVGFRAAKIAPDDFKAQDEYLAKRLAKMTAEKSPWLKAHIGMSNTYKKYRSRAAELKATAEDLFERINAVRPAVSRVTVTPAK